MPCSVHVRVIFLESKYILYTAVLRKVVGEGVCANAEWLYG